MRLRDFWKSVAIEPAGPIRERKTRKSRGVSVATTDSRWPKSAREWLATATAGHIPRTSARTRRQAIHRGHAINFLGLGAEGGQLRDVLCRQVLVLVPPPYGLVEAVWAWDASPFRWAITRSRSKGSNWPFPAARLVPGPRSPSAYRSAQYNATPRVLEQPVGLEQVRQLAAQARQLARRSRRSARGGR